MARRAMERRIKGPSQSPVMSEMFRKLDCSALLKRTSDMEGN